MKFGGAIVGKGANETYDDYLLTAVQSDIATLRDDYDSKRTLSDGLSGAGDACLVIGALLTVYSVIRSGDDAGPRTAELPAFSITPDFRQRQVAALWRRAF